MGVPAPQTGYGQEPKSLSGAGLVCRQEIRAHRGRDTRQESHSKLTVDGLLPCQLLLQLRPDKEGLLGVLS